MRCQNGRDGVGGCSKRAVRLRDSLLNDPVRRSPVRSRVWLRLFVALAIGLPALAAAVSCDSGAVGVNACRDIEDARCEAGLPCGIIADVAACKRFYRDHCLHGLASLTVPSADQVGACTNTIALAGECSAEGHTELTDCPDPPSSSTELTLVCDVVQEPQATAECDFLNDPPPPSDGDDG